MHTKHLDDDGNFPCLVCELKLKTLKALRNHLYRHDPSQKEIRSYRPKGPKGPFECETCQKVVQCYSNFIHHQRSHMNRRTGEIRKRGNPQNPYECPLCHMKVSNTTSFKRHFTNHLETNPFRCKFGGCKKTFGDYYHLTKHIVAVHTKSGKFLKCTVCPSKYCNEYYFQRHYKEHHKGIPCPLQYEPGPINIFNCIPEPFNTTADSTKPPSPEKASKSLNEAENDDRMELESIHIDDRNIKEEFDEDVLDLKGEDNSDTGNSGEVDSEPALVALQNKALIEDPVVLRLQKEDPEGAKLIEILIRLAKRAPTECFKCTICGWSGAWFTYYEQHMKKSHNISPDPDQARVGPSQQKVNSSNNGMGGISLGCGTCGYQSKSSEDLQTHMKIHFGDRNFPCTKCGRRFVTKSRLQVHDKTVHGDGKKFPCEKCHVIVSSKASLAKHLREVHGTKKHFECPTCSKVLTTYLGLKEHKRRHANKSPSKNICQICGQSYSTVHVLSRHIQLVHTRTLTLKRYKKYRNPKTNNIVKAEDNNSSSCSAQAKTELTNSSSEIPVNDVTKPNSETNETPESCQIVQTTGSPSEEDLEIIGF
jgi:hypothetical protein